MSALPSEPHATSTAVPARAGAASPARFAGGAAPDPLRVLVVDDEPTIRGVIAQVLRLDGHDATEAASAEEALATFRERPYPLVITDVVMPGRSGLDLLRDVKTLEPDTLVAVMTSQASLEIATSALRGGAYDFLIKPFDDLILISALVERAGDKIALQSRNRLLANQLEVYARELERLNANLKQMADGDWLTGLPNRRRLRDALDAELSRAPRGAGEFAVALLDVDHFKHYNDHHGHLAGDEVLRGLARLLQYEAEAGQVSARWGGEEFVVLMPGATREDARRQAEAIRERVAKHAFEHADEQPGGAVTVSVGIACYPGDGTDARALLGAADAALYRAKGLGRNRVEG